MTQFALFFFFNDTAPTEIYTLSLHDALPICPRRWRRKRPGTSGKSRWARQTPAGPPPRPGAGHRLADGAAPVRSEEHTSELQSHSDLVCRLLLEKKKLAKPSRNHDTSLKTA